MQPLGKPIAHREPLPHKRAGDSCPPTCTSPRPWVLLPATSAPPSARVMSPRDEGHYPRPLGSECRALLEERPSLGGLR